LQTLNENPTMVHASLIADNRLDELPEMSALEKMLPPSTSAIEYPLDLRPVTEIRDNNQRFDGCSVQIVALTFSYERNVPILSNCSFFLEPGSVYLLKGKNGAGKSTLSRILAGLLKPFRPCFLVNGEATLFWQEPGSIFCYHYQNPDAQLFATSVSEELAMAPKEFKLANVKQLVGDVAECFGLSGILHEHPLDLPFVLRKRVALAACFTSGRPWIILDEPTLGQDDLTCRSLANTIKKLVQKQVGFLIISHSRHFVDMLPSRTLHLQNGAIEVD
jgi:energy-coupling factor transport system ATP-binding protein